MSAWLVDKVHIDLIVGATEAGADPVVATKVGRMLWVENLKSIHARYPDTAEDPTGGDRPGPMGVTDEQIREYVYAEQPYRLTRSQLKYALACLDYQSCEHPEWPKSEARAFVVRELTMLADLPDAKYGSEEAGPWGWDATEVAKRTTAAA